MLGRELPTLLRCYGSPSRRSVSPFETEMPANPRTWAECHAFFSGAATLDPGSWAAWLGKRSKSASDMIKLYGILGSETVRPH